MTPIEPDERQLAELAATAGTDADGPVVMLNLNRYRPGGRDAYARYGSVALRVLERLGGRILWHKQAGQTVIGDEGDRYDEVIAVLYPSRSAFLALVTDPEILAARADRTQGLERATLICCDPGAEPGLAGG